MTRLPIVTARTLEKILLDHTPSSWTRYRPPFSQGSSQGDRFGHRRVSRGLAASLNGLLTNGPRTTGSGFVMTTDGPRTTDNGPTR